MRKDLIVVGLIGGIGSGKSLVASLFKKLGADVADADKLAHHALDRTDVKRKLIRSWGPSILAGGRIDRTELARVAFRAPQEAKRLNAIVHPAVRREIRRHIRKARGRMLVIDAPLLLEAGADRDCTAVVFVDAPSALRARRAARRGMEPSELRRRERLQWPLRLKISKADYILSNAGSKAQVQRLVRKLYRKLTSF